MTVVPEAPESPDLGIRVFQTLEVISADLAFFIPVLSVDSINKKRRQSPDISLIMKFLYLPLSIAGI